MENFTLSREMKRDLGKALGIKQETGLFQRIGSFIDEVRANFSLRRLIANAPLAVPLVAYSCGGNDPVQIIDAGNDTNNDTSNSDTAHPTNDTEKTENDTAQSKDIPNTPKDSDDTNDSTTESSDTGAEGCKLDSDCDDKNPCTTDKCAGQHECKTIPVKNGTACDDKDPCTIEDICESSTCSGIPLDANDVKVASPNKDVVDFTQCLTVGAYEGECLPKQKPKQKPGDASCTDVEFVIDTETGKILDKAKYLDQRGDPMFGKCADYKGTYGCFATAPKCEDGNDCTTDKFQGKGGAVFLEYEKFLAETSCVGSDNVAIPCDQSPCDGIAGCNDENVCFSIPKPAGEVCFDGDPSTKGEECDGAGNCVVQ